MQYKNCECGCAKVIPVRNMWGKPKRFYPGHSKAGQFKKGHTPWHKIYRTPNMIKCQCGCGQETEDIDSRGRPRKYVHGHGGRTTWFSEGQKAGEANPNWKGGRKKMMNGYILALAPGHPRANKRGYVREHIIVMESKLGRMLKEGEVVHHINHIKDDNRPDNLMLFPSNTEHLRAHPRKYPKKDEKVGQSIKQR